MQCQQNSKKKAKDLIREEILWITNSNKSTPLEKESRPRGKLTIKRQIMRTKNDKMR